MGRRGLTSEEPQGVDKLLFQAFEAYSVLMGIHISNTDVQGVLGDALLLGNAHICVINIGKCIDKREDAKHSLKSIWNDFSSFIEISNNEKNIIKKGLNHPTDSSYLKNVYSLRNEVYAHNSRVQTTIENQDIERALHFCFRCWHLLSELLTEYPMILPFKDFYSVKWKLDLILTRTQYNDFRKSWEQNQTICRNWLSTSLE